MRPIAPTPTRRKSVALACESLEDRTLPAGNVTAFVSAGILNITGDAAANRLLVAATGEHTFVISSVDGTTTINGGAGADRFLFASIADSPLAAPDTIADFTPGVDQLAFQGLLRGSFAYLGTGALIRSLRSQGTSTVSVQPSPPRR